MEVYSLNDVKSILDTLQRDIKARKCLKKHLEKLNLNIPSNYKKFLELQDINFNIKCNKLKLIDLHKENKYIFDSSFESVILNLFDAYELHTLLKQELENKLKIKTQGVQVSLDVRRTNKDKRGEDLSFLFSNINYIININDNKKHYTSLKGVIEFLQNRNIKQLNLVVLDLPSGRINNSFIDHHILNQEAC